MSSQEILFKLDQPSGTITLNLGFPNDSLIQIAAYQALGLTSSAPLFISFLDIPTSSVIAGTTNQATLPMLSTAYPLFFNQFPDTAVQLNIPITIMAGDNQMPDKRMIQYKIFDMNNNPPVFQTMLIRLTSIPVSRYSPVYGTNEVNQKEVNEMVGRNEINKFRFGQRDHSFRANPPDFS